MRRNERELLDYCEDFKYDDEFLYNHVQETVKYLEKVKKKNSKFYDRLRRSRS